MLWASVQPQGRTDESCAEASWCLRISHCPSQGAVEMDFEASHSYGNSAVCVERVNLMTFSIITIVFSIPEKLFERFLRCGGGRDLGPQRPRCSTHGRRNCPAE